MCRISQLKKVLFTSKFAIAPTFSLSLGSLVKNLGKYDFEYLSQGFDNKVLENVFKKILKRILSLRIFEQFQKV